jgi:hypothetical protein
MEAFWGVEIFSLSREERGNVLGQNTLEGSSGIAEGLWR